MKRCPDPRLESAGQLHSPAEIVGSGLCIGCGGCAAADPRASMQWEKSGFLKPAGPDEWYEAPSEFVAQSCPFSPGAANEDSIAAERFASAAAHDAAIGSFEAAYVGHAAEDPFRPQGSSGGLTSWVAAELLRTGMVDGVAHVVPSDSGATRRLFRYTVSPAGTR